MTLPGGGPGVADATVAAQVEIQAKYAGYIARQQDEVARQRGARSTPLPRDLDYGVVRGLSIEVRQKLAQHRPETIGQASRIQGVTPAAISLLLVHLKRRAGAREGSAGEASAAQEVRAGGELMHRPKVGCMTIAAARGAVRTHDRHARTRACGSPRSALALADCAGLATARRVSRSAREVEPRLQPDRHPRARTHGHASPARLARGGAARAGAARVLDVGSGAGLPGIPLAVAVRRWHVTLLESNHKKSAFLTQAALELQLANVQVVTERVESWQPEARFDTIVSRAFAELGEFASLAGRPPRAAGRARRDEGRASVRGDRAAAAGPPRRAGDAASRAGSRRRAASRPHGCASPHDPDHRDRQPEGRGRQDHDHGEPRRRARRRRAAGAARRSRSAGQRDHGRGASTSAPSSTPSTTCCSG